MVCPCAIVFHSLSTSARAVAGATARTAAAATPSATPMDPLARFMPNSFRETRLVRRSSSRAVSGPFQASNSRRVPLARRHSIHEDVQELGGGRRIQVAEGDEDVAELREDPEVAVHAGCPAAVTVMRRR